MPASFCAAGDLQMRKTGAALPSAAGLALGSRVPIVRRTTPPVAAKAGPAWIGPSGSQVRPSGNKAPMDLVVARAGRASSAPSGIKARRASASGTETARGRLQGPSLPNHGVPARPSAPVRIVRTGAWRRTPRNPSGVRTCSAPDGRGIRTGGRGSS